MKLSQTTTVVKEIFMKTLQHFNEFVKEINESKSRLYKQSVLQKYKEDEIVKRYLQIAFDPFRVYGISSKKLNKRIPYNDDVFIRSSKTIFELFEYLQTHSTGTTTEIIECQCHLYELRCLASDCESLLASLICKNLSIGVDAKTINKEIPDLIPTFNIQLANKYFDKPEYVEGKSFALTTKIDGGRIIAYKENGQVFFFTRAGQRYEGLVDLEDEMLRLMPDNICLDGEITLLEKGTLTSKEQYKETMKIVRTKDKEKHGIKMLVFDWMPVEDFKRQQCNLSYMDRRHTVLNIFSNINCQYFELLPLLYVGSDVSKIETFLEQQIEAGEEGLMINIYNAPYEFKRTNSLLKVKKMNTVDLEIIGFEEGEGRLAGTLGAILVRYKEGNTVKVGSGFSDSQRTEIWEAKDDYLGTICEIQYFEETTNADGGISLRFPVFKDFRTDKTEADY